MIRLLDVGSSDTTNASIFKSRGEIEVVRMDIDPVNKPDIVHDINNPFPDNVVGKFDIVLASHVLEHIQYRNVLSVAKNIVSAAKPGGEVWIFVPSMEWCARQFLSGRETLGLISTVWGGQTDDWDYHYCGFTSNSLAVLMSKCGLKDIRVKEDDIAVVIDGVQYPSMQITALGIA